LANYREPVAVIGLGRFGRSLALELVRRGTEVLAIDSEPSIAQRLSGQISQIVVADTTDMESLRDIGVPDFSRAVVAIGADMEASILTTSLLSELDVQQIWAKALSPEHARILDRVGAHRVVMPEHEMGQRIAHLVSDQMLDYLEIDQDWVLVKTQPPKELCGIPLDNQRLRKSGVAVVSVKPAGQDAFRHVDPDTHLSYGDQIVVAGCARDVDKFIQKI
jgi:trk system potassium uptake protein TrkA